LAFIKNIKSILCLVVLFLIAQYNLVAQGFVENLGQWEEPFYFKSSGPASQLFIEKNAILFHAWDGETWSEFLEAAHDRKPFSGPDQLQHHAYRMKFLGANEKSFTEKLYPSVHYLNYYVGNDESRWKSGVREYEELIIRELYMGIDLRIKKHGHNIKYDLIVKPGADVKKIRWRYEGIHSLALKEGNLELETSLGKAVELKPFAFQESDGGKKEVHCVYKIKKSEISFELPEGYDSSRELVIDPVLIFSTFTGATSDNWGYTATYDNQGNGYAGGIAFGFGYPLSAGAFQTNFGGGNLDISVSKFGSTGTNLLFSTFIGGNGPEMPHSMVVDSQDNLIIMGNTGSTNYPVSANAFDTGFNGGAALSYWGLALYNSGSDIVVTKLNAAGTGIVGSTYIGGTGNDGHNLGANLSFNYSDEFRGEVVVDNQDNIYVTSSTSSSNFPTLNPFQPGYGGGLTDAVVFELNPGLTALGFSSYFGGFLDDSGYGIQLNSAGEVYFCGGTESPNLPVTPGVVNPAYGGNMDGYLVRLNQAGNAISACTYIGTANYNQTFFVQLDGFDNVFVTGQSIGGYPIQAGPSGTVYSNPGTGQFVHKMNPALTTTIMSTCFGANQGGASFNLVPSAFLVDVCNYIYIAGWGGETNTAGGNVLGMPLTPNAFQSNTNGNDFYLLVFKEDAVGLHYGTYFGGSTPEHVDGGTSRFDKDGIVYQAICAGCGGFSDLPVTPDAYSTTNNSVNRCNLALVKFDVSDYTALISPNVPPQVCVGTNVSFINESTGGTSFIWLFGDGASANTYNSQHTYTVPGTYTVTLIATQQAACIPSDTATTQITIIPPPVANIDPVNTICPGTSLQLNATGATNYQWLPAAGLPQGEQNISNPTVSPAVTTTYTVIGSAQCGSDTVQVTVPVVDFSISINNPDTICLGSSIQLSSSGGFDYVWSPSQDLNNSNIPNPVATPQQTTIFNVSVTGPQGCVLEDSVRIQVDIFPQTTAGPDLVICQGASTQLQATGGTFFNWFPPTGLSNANISNPIASPTDTIQYVVTGTNTCGFDIDTIIIFVKQVFPLAGPDTLICPGTSVQLYAYGGETYKWFPPSYLNNRNSQFPVASPLAPTTYVVEITDSIGCVAYDTLRVNIFPEQYPSAGPDLYIEFGESESLIASGGTGNYQWNPPTFLSCTNCAQPLVTPEITTGYVLSLTDSNNCVFTDTVTVFVSGDIWVPNVFTPGDVNGLNDLFLSLGRDIRSAEMMVFNRWGELLFSSADQNHGWDGYYKGKLCPLGVYVWKIRYTETSGRTGELIGHVTLLR